ncbi:MAG TPA: uroporphyrinogen decarboxylase [Acidobacteriota bacterium]|nr:uroporphyrinogen decarboxylase [Acidobacteriota bacterium]
MLESRFLRACRREEVDCTPVWFMRQAGRFLPEYRQLRKQYKLLELCRNPELALEVTLQPLRRFPLDAAIIFADILLPLPGMGVPFDFKSGSGPVIESPVRTSADIERLRVGEPEEELKFVFDALRLVRAELPKDKALIGFAGAPFTLASYMIEGGYSRNFLLTKRLMSEDPQSWHRLMTVVSEVTIRYLEKQVEAGADALQLFDSWVGCLGPSDYKEFVQPYSRQIFEALSKLGVPTIHFSTGTSGFLALLRDSGGTVQSIDWRIQLDQAWSILGNDVAVQGNLDPVALLAPPELLHRRVEDILQRAGGRKGHIFNLGHGILPQTPIENVERVVDWVHSFSGSTPVAAPDETASARRE